MIAKVRECLVVALLVLGAGQLTVRNALAQSDSLPPAPLPAPVPAPPPALLGTPIPAQPAGPFAPVSPAPGPAQPADPGRDGWADLGATSRSPGFFMNYELQLLGPSLKQRLQGNVTYADGTTDTVHVPQADLDWTVSPKLELGYRLPDSLGSFILGYRFLVTDGSTNLSSDLGDFFVKSRLNFNQIDIDYASAQYSPLARYTFQWRIGARIIASYFDSRIGNDFYEARASNYFYGAGPHGMLDFERRFKDLPELGMFTRLDGAVAVGEVTQRFNEAFVDEFGNVPSAGSSLRRTQAVQTILFQAGLSYRPFGPADDHLRFTLGYQYEHWFNLGKLLDSRGELTTQGIFFRGEVDF